MDYWWTRAFVKFFMFLVVLALVLKGIEWIFFLLLGLLAGVIIFGGHRKRSERYASRDQHYE